MYKKILAALFVICFALPVFAKRQSEEIITPMTQLQKRQFQTRVFASGNQATVMKGVLNVLQDEGFIVYNVNSLLGFIYGVKDFDTTDPNVDISKEFGLTKSRLNYNGVKVATLEVAVNVTEYPDSTRIRTNFKRKLLNEYGNAQLIDDIDEAEFYEDFYAKLNNAIALQKGRINRRPAEVPAAERVPQPQPQPIVQPQPQPQIQPPVQVQPQVQQQEQKIETIVEQVPANIEKTSVKEIQNELPIIEEAEADQEKIDKKKAKEEAKALKEQQKLEKELEKEKAKQAKEQAKIEKELNKIYQ